MANLEPPQDAPPTSDTSFYPATEALFRSLSTYRFDTDVEYHMGLAALLGHPAMAAEEEELVEKKDLAVQTQCFYFSRKFGTAPIDPVAYSSWLASRGPSPHDTTTTPLVLPPYLDPTTSTSASTSQQPPAATSAPEPPYPDSFAALVDLITRRVPIPGIEEIPTTILEHGSSKVDKTPRRMKPWEKDGETDSTAAETGAQAAEVGQSDNRQVDVETVDVNGHKETGQGVVNILKPNAIPDSGLLSQD